MSEQKPALVNQSGPVGSHGCACRSADARWCYIVRYDVDPADDDLDDHRCECLCHTWSPHRAMVCGVDCHPGDAVCNNYCNLAPHKGPMAKYPPKGPDA